MTPSLSAETLCNRYEKLYTGLVTDVLDDLGYKDQTMQPSLSPIDRTQTFAGVAYPAVGRSNRSVDYDRQIRRFLEMIGEAPEHSVLALEANDTSSAQIGELTTAALSVRGCRGVVTDGGLRDTEFVLDQEFPVYCNHLTPADSLYRWELLDWDTTAVVGGVEVAPGDFIVGDIDGVAVVPEHLVEEVLHEAEAMRADEDRVREEILAGNTPLDVYEKYNTF